MSSFQARDKFYGYNDMVYTSIYGIKITSAYSQSSSRADSEHRKQESTGFILLLVLLFRVTFCYLIK